MLTESAATGSPPPQRGRRAWEEAFHVVDRSGAQGAPRIAARLKTQRRFGN